MLISEKIDNFLEEELDDSDYEFMEDADLMEKMFDLISNLDTEKLSDEQIEQATEITELVAGRIKPEGVEGAEKEEEEVSEFTAKRVRINRSVKRKRKKLYKKKRAKLKLKAKRFRKTAKFKRWKRLSKRKKKSGKTSTGKKIRKFI
jgi:hypothetical protein